MCNLNPVIMIMKTSIVQPLQLYCCSNTMLHLILHNKATCPILNFAHFNSRKGQIEVARGLLERSLALDASLAEAASSLAELERQQGRTSKAETLHRRAIKLNSRSAPIRNNYATFLHDQGQCRQSQFDGLLHPHENRS